MDYKELIPNNEMIEWRRYLHANPELSFKEFGTAAYIKSLLESFGDLEITQPTPTSVVGVLKTGRPGKTIALRADIDALPVTEETDLDFASKNPGVMHACGHDSHTTMLLGAAKVLVELKDKLSGEIRFIFQHAEELLPGGAIELVEAGVIDGVDMIFGLHVGVGLPIGMVATNSGPLMASADMFDINITGKGAHASMPHLSIDPITIGSEIVNSLNTIISRNIDSAERAVISYGQFTSGKASNIIPQVARIQGSVRTFNQDIRMFIKDKIETITNHICEMNGAKVDIKYTLGTAPVINDEEAFQHVVSAVEKLGYHFYPLDPAMGSEDFSAYLNKVPGCYYMMGAGTAEDGHTYNNHHPKFTLDENVLATGCAMHVQTIINILG
ncbi:MAG: amidohydrolase [Tissierellia bacterium]|nr:amidohydrolase [Tissierellia bacterium]